MHEPDDIPTEVIPRVRIPSTDPPTEVIPTIATRTLPEGLHLLSPATVPGVYATSLAELVSEPAAWSPRWRPWRRPLCWMVLGHLWYPGADGCLECGKPMPRHS